MKRSSSDIDSSPPPTSPATPVKIKGEPNTPSSSAKKAKSSKSPKEKEIQGEWTPEKKGSMMDEIISAGAEKLGKGYLAEKYDMTKTQISNAVQCGRKGNLRDKAVQAVKL